MKPVRQTDFGKGTGDCWAACIASILELPLSEVPNFCHDDLRSGWLKRTINWLYARGIGIIYIEDAGKALSERPHLVVGCFCILTGRSPRAKDGEDDFLHSVVGFCKMKEVKDGYQTVVEFTHDPHPSNDFIVGDPRDIAILVPVIVDHVCLTPKSALKKTPRVHPSPEEEERLP